MRPMSTLFMLTMVVPTMAYAQTDSEAPAAAPSASEPAWARHLRTAGHSAQTAAHVVPTHHGGGGAHVSLAEEP